MDPATLTFLTAATEFARNFGVLGVVMAVLILVMRAWQRGDFLPRTQVEQNLKLVEQRFLDLLERYKEVVAERDEWQNAAERGIKAAEIAQSEHASMGQLLSRIDENCREALREIRERRPGAR